MLNPLELLIPSRSTRHRRNIATARQDGYQDRLAIEIFRRLGKKITIQILPGERSLINLNQGIDDATFVRIKGIRKTYPNVRMVPEKIMDWVFVAFAKNPTIELSGWNDLKPYSVAFMNGWKIFETNVKDVKFITKVGSPPSLFGLIDKGRAEVVLFEKWSGLQIVNEQRMKEVRELSPPLATREMFMYVHKKHEPLIGKLTEIIRSMKADGTYDKIFEQTLGKLTAK